MEEFVTTINWKKFNFESPPEIGKEFLCCWNEYCGVCIGFWEWCSEKDEAGNEVEFMHWQFTDENILQDFPQYWANLPLVPEVLTSQFKTIKEGNTKGNVKPDLETKPKVNSPRPMVG